MSANFSKNTPENKLVETIKSILKKLENLKTNQLSTLVVPTLTSDPATTVNGQIWYNTTSNELKVKKNGTVRTITTS